MTCYVECVTASYMYRGVCWDFMRELNHVLRDCYIKKSSELVLQNKTFLARLELVT